MPNITIYVSKQDEQTFEKARNLQDSLSKVIAAALKIYLQQREEKDLGG